MFSITLGHSPGGSPEIRSYQKYEAPAHSADFKPQAGMSSSLDGVHKLTSIQELDILIIETVLGGQRTYHRNTFNCSQQEKRVGSEMFRPNSEHSEHKTLLP